MNLTHLKKILKDKNVLITGGTGSFGKACASYLLQHDLCNKVIIFSRDEWKQWQMQENPAFFNHPKIRFFLGDVRDYQRLRRAFHEVHFVIHAAALKQVPAAEYNPSECVKTNVTGAMNIIEAALEAKVEKVIALSTDKAVNPVNLYGASKLCSDKLLVHANAYSGKEVHPIFSVVRYGNVLGSRGSLLPHWKTLIDKGATSLPITDERMTRFWITLDEAVLFVLASLQRALGGEIFIPKAPSVKIVNLAKAFAPKLKHTICGIRPGEKIHEVLLSSDDARDSFEIADGYVHISSPTSRAYCYYSKEAKPGQIKLDQVKKVADDFIYASNQNPLTLDSIDAIRSLIAKVKFE